jgi:hypothetical protein
MDTTAQKQEHTDEITLAPTANDNVQPRLERPVMYDGAIARIYRPSRSATTSGIARTRKWLLVFEPRSAPFVEPLMGWTGSRDPLTQIELAFPSREAAVAYAESQRLNYIVQTESTAAGSPNMGMAARKEAFSDEMMDRLGLGLLQEQYGRALRETQASSDSETSPMDVVRNPQLSKEEKREMLMKWAWDEYLAQSMFDRTSESSRLREVERAIVELESGPPQAAADAAASALAA